MRNWDKLTSREFEVAYLTAHAHRHESIANQLDISISTVTRHVTNICNKIRVNTSLEICSYFWQDKVENILTVEVITVRRVM